MATTSTPAPTRNAIVRSRGCRTCRARKVRCDQNHPFCHRCARAGIECRGYLAPTTFMAAPTTTVPTAALNAPELSLTAEPRTLPYPDEPKHIACLAQGMLVDRPSVGQGFSWIRDGLCASPAQDFLLYTSARCLARVFYARHFKQRTVLTDGLVHYGEMLPVLRAEIAGPGFSSSSGAMAGTAAAAQGVARPRTLVLVQVILMSVLLESVVAYTVGGRDFSGMHSHLGGLAQLLRARGPRAFQRGPGTMLFEVCRCYIVGRAINLRRPTFLAELQWKTIPWKHEKKHAFTEIWDILCDVPTLLYDLERLNLTSIQWPMVDSINWAVLEVQGSIVNPTHNLSLKLNALLQSLFDWRWKWDHHCHENSETGPTNPNNTVVTDHHGNPQFRNHLIFSDLAFKEIMYYQSTLVLALRISRLVFSNDLLDSVDRTAPLDMAQPLPPTVLLRPTEIGSLEDAIWEFYRSMEGYLCGRTDQPAPEFHHLMFPLLLVSLGIKQDSIEQMWVAKIRAKMMGTHGHNLWADGG